MSTKSDYSPEEWRAISGAPVAAGLLVALADRSGPVGIAQEAMAAGKAIARSASGEGPEIMKSLAESMKNSDGRPDLADVPTGDRAQTKSALIGAIKLAVRTVQTKSPGEVEVYKAWLASVAARMSQTSKEGGFLGFGGSSVSSHEEEALSQLAEVLRISTRPRTRPS
jgi:hypothetical protein